MAKVKLILEFDNQVQLENHLAQLQENEDDGEMWRKFISWVKAEEFKAFKNYIKPPGVTTIKEDLSMAKQVLTYFREDSK